VRYIVNFNNGSTTEPNGVSELSLALHRATVITTKHSPAESARAKEIRGGGGVFHRELPDSRLQSLSRTTNFAARFFRAEMLFTRIMPTHAEKNGGRRALFP
jgi:hypothetical protein